VPLPALITLRPQVARHLPEDVGVAHPVSRLLQAACAPCA